MGSQHDQNTEIKFLQSCHFAHITRSQERFKYIINFQRYQEGSTNKGRVKGIWEVEKEESRKMYNGVISLF